MMTNFMKTTPALYCNLITNTLLCTDYELFDMF